MTSDPPHDARPVGPTSQKPLNQPYVDALNAAMGATFSIEDVADAAGVSYEAARQWVRGIARPNEKFWPALERLFNMTMGSLFAQPLPSPTGGPTDPLLQAATDAGLTVADLAREVGVTVRVAEAWFAGKLPDAEQRLEIARVVGVPRSDLWPALADPHIVSTVREWPGLGGIPDEVWRASFTAATDIDIQAGSSQFLADKVSDLREVLAAKVRLGHGLQMRVLFSDPNGEQTRLRDEQEAADPNNEMQPGDVIQLGRIGLRRWAYLLDGIDGAELRVLDSPEMWKRSIFRFDDRMFEYQYIPGRRGFRNSVQEHHRVEVVGRFSDYLAGFEWCWDRGTVITRDSVGNGNGH